MFVLRRFWWSLFCSTLHLCVVFCGIMCLGSFRIIELRYCYLFFFIRKNCFWMSNRQSYIYLQSLMHLICIYSLQLHVYNLNWAIIYNLFQTNRSHQTLLNFVNWSLVSVMKFRNKIVSCKIYLKYNYAWVHWHDNSVIEILLTICCSKLSN